MTSVWAIEKRGDISGFFNEWCISRNSNLEYSNASFNILSFTLSLLITNPDIILNYPLTLSFLPPSSILIFWTHFTGLDKVVNDDNIENANLAEIASKYTDIFLEKIALTNNSLGCAVLGMGPDGHTCSLFPQNEAMEDGVITYELPGTSTVGYIEDSPKLPPKRITLKLEILNNCQACIFVACGEGKKQILSEIFKTVSSNEVAADGIRELIVDNVGEMTTNGYPCAWVMPVRRNAEKKTFWYIDESAASGIV